MNNKSGSINYIFDVTAHKIESSVLSFEIFEDFGNTNFS